MIHVFCTRKSTSARQLVNGIRGLGGPGRRLKRTHSRRVRVGDVVVNWGEQYAPITGKVLNQALVHNKYRELERMWHGGVLVVPFTRFRPNELGWVGRMFNHRGGSDLLNPPLRPDFWVKRLDIVKEFRVHVWGGLSRRVGIKIPREDFLHPHHWVRSFDAGWRLDYGKICQDHIRQRHRDPAKAAVEALGYDFGAVDVGESADGKVFVFEVNAAPGLHRETLRLYAENALGVHDEA